LKLGIWSFEAGVTIRNRQKFGKAEGYIRVAHFAFLIYILRLDF